MWLFTKRGFLSVILKHGEDPDDDQAKYVVRARSQDHLANYFMPTRIIRTDEADYAYRVEVRYYELLDLTREICEEIDYFNFKDACKDDGSYHTLLERIWSHCFMYQLDQEDFGRLGMVSKPEDAIVRRLTGSPYKRQDGQGEDRMDYTDEYESPDSTMSAEEAGLQVPSSGSTLDSDRGQQGDDNPAVLPWYRRIFR